MVKARVHNAELRARLLSRAAEMIGTEGFGALSLRRLADAEGTSTAAIYSLFGGKDGLMTAVFVDAFARFAAGQRAVARGGDPVTELTALGWDYYDWWERNPHLYAIMFGGSRGDWEPPPDVIEETLDGLAPLQETVATLPDLAMPAEVAAILVWSTVHGVLSLHSAGSLHIEPDALRHVYGEAMAGVIRAIRR